MVAGSINPQGSYWMTPRERGRLDGWYGRDANPPNIDRQQYNEGYAAGERHQQLVRQRARRNGGFTG